METRIVFLALVHIILVVTNGQAVQPTQNNLITQTVYGFLDFTTTIGNTVMVFSPQSASIKVDPKPTTPPIHKEIIESKPSKPITKKPIDIKPSKTEKPLEHKPSKPQEKILTVVNVISQSVQPPDSKITKPSPSSIVNVIKASSVVNVIASPSIISSKVEVVEAAPTNSPSNSIITKVEVVSAPPHSSKVETISSSDSDSFHVGDSALIFGNNIGEPEYEFLSRQPSEVVEETYKVINFKPPSSKFILKPRQSVNAKNKGASKKTNTLHPTGLVTRLGGTVVKDGVTTVHETSVIGTYISGKYAQVLQSTSHVLSASPKGKISPSPTLRILKTAAPLSHKGNNNRHLEPTPAGSINQETALDFGVQNSIKSTKKAGGQQFKLRYKNRQNENVKESNESRETTTQPSYKKKSSRNRSTSKSSKQNTSHRTNKLGRGNRKKTTTTTPSSVHSNDEFTTPSTGTTKRYHSNGRRNKQHRSGSSESTNNNNNSGGFSRRSYKPKVQTSAVETGASTSLYKFKLNRSPGRWQYKTTPKPRVTIRKQNNQPDEAEYKNETSAPVFTPPHTNETLSLSNEVSTPQSRQQDDADGLEGSESIASIIDDDSSMENKLDTPSFPLETIKVEISTPPDFKDIYYEIATIKSPYTFQVGSVKNTRFITVTSTIEKSLVNTEEPTISPTPSAPLTENILATSSNYDKDNNFLDSSVATLPPIYLASDMETPPLETLTETFSTTETMLKTHILPIIHSPNDTSLSTLVQTYLVTRLVTATKTLPPMEAYHFIPSKTLNEFNSHLDEAGSELHLELEFGDQNEQEEGLAKRVFPPDLDLANIGSKFDLSDVDKSRIPENHLRLKKAHTSSAKTQLLQEPVPTPGLSPEQLQQLALLRFLNPAAAGQLQVITTSKPVIRIETLYESHVIPITNGPHTFATTLSKIAGTVTKTEYEFGTSTINAGLPPALPFPQAPVNPLFPPLPQAQQQFTVTSSPVVQSTTVTQTTSKVLKLTFGAKTAYTTVLSTTVIPTVLTTYVTASTPVQPTAAFPGFFPAPYPPYPYVG